MAHILDGLRPIMTPHRDGEADIDVKARLELDQLTEEQARRRSEADEAEVRRKQAVVDSAARAREARAATRGVADATTVGGAAATPLRPVTARRPLSPRPDSTRLMRSGDQTPEVGFTTPAHRPAELDGDTAPVPAQRADDDAPDTLDESRTQPDAAICRKERRSKLYGVIRDVDTDPVALCAQNQTTKGEACMVTDGLTVSRINSVVTKLRDAVNAGAADVDEAVIASKQFAGVCGLHNEHDRLHGHFHNCHVLLGHDWLYTGQTYVAHRNLTGVEPSHQRVGQKVRRKFHHECVRLKATINSCIKEMNDDLSYRDRLDALCEDGEVDEGAYVRLLMEFLTDPDGGAEHKANCEHALLALAVKGNKEAIKWRHWPGMYVFESLATRPMYDATKTNYGKMLAEMPFQVCFRSMRHNLDIWCCGLTNTTRCTPKSGFATGEDHEKVVAAAQAGMNRACWAGASRRETGRTATKHGPQSTRVSDHEKMLRLTVNSSLHGAAREVENSTLELETTQRQDYGGVAQALDVKSVSQLQERSRSCARRPDRRALTSHATMLAQTHEVGFAASDVVDVLAVSLVPSTEGATLGQPLLAPTAGAALFPDLPADAVLVAAAVEPNWSRAVGARLQPLQKFDCVVEPLAEGSTATIADVTSLPDAPSTIYLYFYSPKQKPSTRRGDTYHLYLGEEPETQLSPWDLKMKTSLAVDTSTKEEQLEEADADGVIANPLDYVVPRGATAPAATAPLALDHLVHLCTGSPPDPADFVTTRAQNRRASDRKFQQARELVNEGPAALIAVDGSQPPAEALPLDDVAAAITESRAKTGRLLREREKINEAYKQASSEYALLMQTSLHGLRSSTTASKKLETKVRSLKRAREDTSRKISKLEIERRGYMRALTAAAALPAADPEYDDDEVWEPPAGYDSDDSESDFDPDEPGPGTDEVLATVLMAGGDAAAAAA